MLSFLSDCYYRVVDSFETFDGYSTMLGIFGAFCGMLYAMIIVFC